MKRYCFNCPQILNTKKIKKVPGKKIPNATIPDNKFRTLVVKIVLWILSDNVLNNLLIFDASSFFTIFYKIFTDERIKDILEKKELDNYTDNTTKLLDLKYLSI